MNQLQVFFQIMVNECKIAMEKNVMGGGTQLEDSREIIKGNIGSSLKSIVALDYFFLYFKGGLV